MCGVSYAVSTKGGPKVRAEYSDYVIENGELRAGKVFLTSAGNLKCKYVIHGDGPIMPLMKPED